MKYKKGITTASIVIYVILLFAFTTLSLSVSSNLSSGLFDDKGYAINLSNFDKALYYLNKNAMESNNLTLSDNTITFSNGNEFTYDSNSQTLYYNEGILLNNVKNFTVTSIDTNEYTIEIQFIKYLNELTRSIRLCVGE